MIPPLTHRQRQGEWMDRPDADPGQLRASLRFIQRINRALGYTRAMLWHLERFSRNWRKDEPISIVDLATGSADIPRAILRWADNRGFRIRITGVDLHAETVRVAREQNNDDPRLGIVRADVFDLPFADGSFDYAMCAMFLHHLDDSEAVRVLREMGRLARRGVIAADLLRHRRAYAWISALTVFSNPMVRHDARVSVAQAFSRDEVLSLREEAGLDFTTYREHFGHRWALAGERR